MDLQKLFDAFSGAAADSRSKYHLTLGGLIENLKAHRAVPVAFDAGGSPEFPHSYRGYYSDLAFEAGEAPITSCQLLAACEDECLGEEFTGYKGGEYTMSETTPLWLASYGTTSGSRAIIGASMRDGVIVLETKVLDE